MINIQSKLRTTPDLYKTVSLVLLFGNNGNSYTICTVSYVYVHIITQYRDAVRVKEISVTGTAVPRMFLGCHFGNACHTFGCLTIGDKICGYNMQCVKTELMTLNNLSRYMTTTVLSGGKHTNTNIDNLLPNLM
jgi:hypothetical protein